MKQSMKQKLPQLCVPSRKLVITQISAFSKGYCLMNLTPVLLKSPPLFEVLFLQSKLFEMIASRFYI